VYGHRSSPDGRQIGGKTESAMEMQNKGPSCGCVCLRIFGRIQGVGFRYWAFRQAARLRVTGWIRNEADGTVSCECRGREEDLNAFVEALRAGPPGARVDKVDIRNGSPAAAWRSFEIR
jgi:acylphosphatase